MLAVVPPDVIVPVKRKPCTQLTPSACEASPTSYFVASSLAVTATGCVVAVVARDWFIAVVRQLVTCGLSTSTCATCTGCSLEKSSTWLSIPDCAVAVDDAASQVCDAMPLRCDATTP